MDLLWVDVENIGGNRFRDNSRRNDAGLGRSTVMLIMAIMHAIKQ